MSQTKIRIEPTGEKNTGICSCCGHSSRRVWGFAYEGKACLAAYFVHWTLGHIIDRGANLDMIIGRWGEDARAEARSAVGLAYRLTETGPSFMVIDARARPVAQSPLVGTALDRNQVIDTPIAEQAFTIADAVLAHDPRIADASWRVESTSVTRGYYPFMEHEPTHYVRPVGCRLT